MSSQLESPQFGSREFTSRGRRRAMRAQRWTVAVTLVASLGALTACGDRILDRAAGDEPTPIVVAAPAQTPSAPPTVVPSAGPTAAPTAPDTATPDVTPTTVSTPTATPTLGATPTVTLTPTATPTGTPTVSPSPTATHTYLQYDDRGPEVLAMQQRLTELGYWLGTPDGHFGALTQQAVFAVQKAAGLTRDGLAGAKTQQALADGVRASSRVGGTGVEIDLERQLLLVVRDGQVIRILNTSTGNGERYVSRGTEKTARTPEGSFSVYHSVDALEVAELGKLYRPKYFYKGWAVHGSQSIPAYPASHGCARVSNGAMDMIWREGYLSHGTPVTIYR